MTENPQPTASRTNAIALTVLGVVAVLFLASPLTWDYLLPQVGTVFATAWAQLGVMASWVWFDVFMPVFTFLGNLFA